MSWWGSRYYDGFMEGAERAYLGRWRDELLAQAGGDVLEIGAGTGVNLNHYPGSVSSLALCEPDAGMVALLRQRLSELEPAFPVRVFEAPGERLPVEDSSVDVVVSTLVLCTVADLDASIAEVHRVLKPGGRLLFMEHVAEHRRLPYAFQRAATPFWRRFAGGCCLDRKSGEVIAAAGFEVTSLERRPMKGFFDITWPAIVGVAVR